HCRRRFARRSAEHAQGAGAGMSVAGSAIGANRFTLANDRPPRSWVVVVAGVCTFLVLALIWASLAEVDELSRAQGRVIPSGKTQVIQSAEPGVVAEILVRSGEQVRRGQQLIRLDDTTTSSSAGEVGARVRALRAQVARLRTEDETPGNLVYDCPAEIQAAAPGICDNEADLLRVRADSLARNKDVLLQRVEQRRRELAEVKSNRARLETASALASENLNMLKPLADQGLVAQTE